MVGDSQIGKTSLMVKYVEGSFDEDYIQTLGISFSLLLPFHRRESYPLTRRQFYGKDHFRPKNDNHVFNLGSGRSTRVRQHATTCLQ